MASKEPRFFCDFCGTEVKRTDRICPNCGKFFSAVRCPNCGLTGQVAMFIKGCPSCGYAVLPGTESASSPAAQKKQKKARKARPHGKSLRRNNAAKREAETAGDSLPLWVYLAVACLLAAVVAGMVIEA